MGVFRQPPHPLQLAGLSAAIFPPIVNSPPLQAMNPQLMVAAWYTTPNPYRPPLVSYTALFPSVVDAPPIADYSKQHIAATYRPPEQPRPLKVWNVDIMTIFSVDAPVGSQEPQMAAWQVYRSPSYSMAIKPFPSQLFSTPSATINYGRQLLLGVGN